MIYQKNKKIEEIKHLYIHVPFCRSKCRYCDFYSIELKKSFIDTYTKALISELELYEKNISNELKSIYFGGGSPLLLGIGNLKLVLNYIFNILNIIRTNNIEISIELNPYHLIENSSLLNDLSSIGFNRFSIGIQSFSKDILKTINRNFDFSIVNLLKENEDKNISIDMMFSLPNETINDIDFNIENLFKINPKHISWYLFTVKKGVYNSLPKEKVQEQMYSYIIKKLREKYDHYEVSNFAHTGYKSVHNLAYWNRDYYLGLGASSHSFIKFNNKEYRFSNVSSYKDYVADVNKIYNLEELSNVMVNNEKIFLGLRLVKKGFDKALINEEAKELLKNNYLIDMGNKIVINKDKLFLIDEISQRLLSD